VLPLRRRVSKSCRQGPANCLPNREASCPQHASSVSSSRRPRIRATSMPVPGPCLMCALADGRDFVSDSQLPRFSGAPPRLARRPVGATGRGTARRRASRRVTLSYGSSGAAASRQLPVIGQASDSVGPDGAASPSRRRRRRSASRSRRSRFRWPGPLRPPPGTSRPRAQSGSVRRSRRRPRRPPWHRWRTSPTSHCSRSPGRCTPRRRAARRSTAPHSARRCPCSGLERACPRPRASAHGRRSGRTHRGSSPGRTGTSYRSPLARRSERPHRRRFPGAANHRQVVHPPPPPSGSMR